MNFFSRNIKTIMLVSGFFTCSMIYVVVSPQQALQTMFGVTISGSLAEIIARDWGFLITLVGILLIYGAFRPVHQPLIIIFACVGKAMFIGLVLLLGQEFLATAWPSILFDSVVIVVLLTCLVSRSKPH